MTLVKKSVELYIYGNYRRDLNYSARHRLDKSSCVIKTWCTDELRIAVCSTVIVE